MKGRASKVRVLPIPQLKMNGHVVRLCTSLLSTNPLFVMGMFDFVYSFYPLPDSEAQNLEFQTKSLDSCLESFLITKDGQLHAIPGRKEFFDERPFEEEMPELARAGQDTEYHGDIYFYTSGEEDTWYEYKARFIEGQLVYIERASKERGTYIIQPPKPPES